MANKCSHLVNNLKNRTSVIQTKQRAESSNWGKAHCVFFVFATLVRQWSCNSFYINNFLVFICTFTVYVSGLNLIAS